MIKHWMCATAFLALCACDEDPMTMEVPPREQPQSVAELNFVRATLESIQGPSIADDREYCGYIGVDSFGRFVATDPQRGRSTHCTPRWPRGDFRLLASYHSHGAYAPDLDSELPSYADMVTDISQGIDGYVATPAGRVWYIDADARETRLVCGPRCVTADPASVPDAYDPLRNRYGLQDLAARGY